MRWALPSPCFRCSEGTTVTSYADLSRQISSAQLQYLLQYPSWERKFNERSLGKRACNMLVSQDRQPPNFDQEQPGLLQSALPWCDLFTGSAVMAFRAYCLGLVCLAGLCGSVQAATSRQLFHSAQAPAPALPIYGTVGNYEPRNASFYLAQQRSIKAGLQLNQSFYAGVNKSAVPAVRQDKNGTFAIKPAVQPGESQIESANTDGARVTLDVPSPWCRKYGVDLVAIITMPFTSPCYSQQARNDRISGNLARCAQMSWVWKQCPSTARSPGS